MRAESLRDLRTAATPDHIAALRRIATSHPNSRMRASTGWLLTALSTPPPPASPPAPKPAPRSPTLLAELAARGEIVRTTPEEALARTLNGSRQLPPGGEVARGVEENQRLTAHTPHAVAPLVPASSPQRRAQDHTRSSGATG